jgi:hypothetical protein
MKMPQESLLLFPISPEVTPPQKSNNSEGSEASRRKEQKRARNPKNLQDILWDESVRAVQISVECDTKAELIARLHSELPQNSLLTRRRNASTIISRFFPKEGLDQLSSRVYRYYRDDELLEAVMSVLLPIREVVIGQLIAERIHPMPPGSEIPVNFFSKYGEEVDKENGKKIASRCSAAARTLGWVSRQGKKFYKLHKPVNSTAALIMLHSVYAPTPRIVELSQVFSEPVWKYAGFSDPGHLRSFCKELEHKKLISRYTLVDRLEQITTRYSLTELLEKRMRV